MRTRDNRSWMWGQALDLLQQVDRLHREAFEPAPTATGTPCWRPPVDVIETDGEVWILVALPGVSPQRVRAFVQGGTLVIEGERPLPAKAFPGAIRRLEIPYGRFERQIAIPAGHFELREQRFEHGCLLVGLTRLA